MRRLVKHGIAGCGVAAVTIAAGVTLLGSPSQAQVVMAVPASVATSSPASAAPQPSIASSSKPAGTASPTTRQIGLEAERAGAQPALEVRTRLVDLATARDLALRKQNKAIAGQQAKLQKAAEEAKAKRQQALANQGYLPGVTDPREMAKQILANKYEMGDDQYSCFDNIIMRESKWDIHAENRSSGAYGIPQALPGSKMSSIAADWRDNPATQITWGIEYMNKRYGSPCGAWGFKGSHGWY